MFREHAATVDSDGEFGIRLFRNTIFKNNENMNFVNEIIKDLLCLIVFLLIFGRGEERKGGGETRLASRLIKMTLCFM